MNSRDEDAPSSREQAYRLTPNLSEELSLTQGEVIRTNVVSRLPEDPNKLVVTIRGRRVLAESPLDVEENQTLLVRVQSTGSPIELELIDPYDAPEHLEADDLEVFLERNDLPSTPEDVEVLREWLDQSLPLDKSLLGEALDAEESLTHGAGSPDGSRLWALSYLVDEGFPVTEELVDLLSGARDSDPGKDLTLLHRSGGGEFQALESGEDLRSAVRSVGFDLVRQLTRRPHRASKTLHAQLLAGQESSSAPGTRDLNRRLLGVILGVALLNLRESDRFSVFFPFVDDDRVRLAWLRGFRDPETVEWGVDLQVTMEKLGRVGARIERGREELSVTVRTTELEALELLRSNGEQLKSTLQSRFGDVTVQINEESPGREFNPFAADTVSGARSDLTFSPGLDLTV